MRGSGSFGLEVIPARVHRIKTDGVQPNDVLDKRRHDLSANLLSQSAYGSAGLHRALTGCFFASCAAVSGVHQPAGWAVPRDGLCCAAHRAATAARAAAARPCAPRGAPLRHRHARGPGAQPACAIPLEPHGALAALRAWLRNGITVSRVGGRWGCFFSPGTWCVQAATPQGQPAASGSGAARSLSLRWQTMPHVLHVPAVLRGRVDQGARERNGRPPGQEC